MVVVKQEETSAFILGRKSDRRSTSQRRGLSERDILERARARSIRTRPARNEQQNKDFLDQSLCYKLQLGVYYDMLAPN